MIILELLVFLVSIIFFSLSISGFGSLLTHKIKSNFFIDIFFGFIIISLIITFIHFFSKINFLISGSIFLFGFALFFKKKNLSPFFKKKRKFTIFVSNNFSFTNVYISKIP